MREIKFQVPDDTTEVTVTFKMTLTPVVDEKEELVGPILKTVEETDHNHTTTMPTEHVTYEYDRVKKDEPTPWHANQREHVKGKVNNFEVQEMLSGPVPGVPPMSKEARSDVIKSLVMEAVNEMPTPVSECPPLTAPEPKEELLPKSGECPVCHKHFNRLRMHWTTSQCNPKNVGKPIYNQKNPRNVPEIGALRCKHCNDVCRTQQGLDKHEIKCPENPNRKGTFDNSKPRKAKPRPVDPLEQCKTCEQSGEDDCPVEEPTGPCAEKKDEFSLWAEGENAKKEEAPPEEEFEQIVKLTSVCPDCKNTIFVPLEKHKPKCPGKPAEKVEPKVEPLNVSDMRTVEPEEADKFKHFKLPEVTPLKNFRKEKGSRHCQACGCQIDKKRPHPFCDKCWAVTSRRPKKDMLPKAARGAD